MTPFVAQSATAILNELTTSDVVTVGAACVGALIMLIATALPFASLSVGGLNVADIHGWGAPAGLTPWLFGIPVGAYALVLSGISVAAGLGTVVFKGRGPGGLGAPLALLGAAFISVVAFGGNYLIVLGKVHNTNTASAFGLNVSASPSGGLALLLFGALVVAGGGIFALVASTRGRVVSSD